MRFPAAASHSGPRRCTRQEPAARPPQPPKVTTIAEPENRTVTAAPRAKASADPESREAISFQKLALSTEDLIEATGLNIYKFRIDIAKGERFRIVLRSQESKDSERREILGFSFEKTSEDPVIIGVSFLRLDRKLSGFLLSTEDRAEYRLSCSNCKPGGLATYVNNPLGTLDSARRTFYVFRSSEETKDNGVDAKETLLLRACDGTAPRGVKGVNLDGYPRAEVVVVKDQ